VHGLDTNPIDDPYIKSVELYVEVGLSLPSPIKISKVAVWGASENADEGSELFGSKLVGMRGDGSSIGAEKPDFTGQSINDPGVSQEFRVCHRTHEGLQNDGRRSLDLNPVSPGDSSSHAMKFERMNRCKLCSIQHRRDEAVSYDRAMR
jgi:hypothetical protein